jgi:TRAP-type uncharacterized transport system substrate-binding protein
VLLLILAAILVAAASITVSAALRLLRPAAPETLRVHLATDVVPLRIYLAEQLREEAASHQLDLVLSSHHHGSLEALDLVDAPNEFKLALVPGGVKARDYPSVRQVATLTTEPLHVLVRPELASRGLSGLKGKRVAIGPPTTSSHHVALEVLAFVGLTPTGEKGTGGYVAAPDTPEDLLRELERIESLTGPDRAQAIQALPDAVIYFSPIPGIAAGRFVRTAGYRLLPIPFAEAFCLERRRPTDPKGVRIEHALFTATTIPPCTYGANPPVPAEPCPTLAAPLLLVAQDDTDPRVIVRLLEVLYDSPLTNVMRPQPLREQVYAFPPHPGTERYLHRHDPLLKPEQAADLAKLAGGIGALVSGVVAVYEFYRLRRLRRFEAFYRKIGQIDRQAQGLEVDPEAPTDPELLRAHLEGRLTTLRHEALEDFREGGLKGEGLLMGILALINDTRKSLPGMMRARDGPHQDSTPSGAGQS